MLPYADSRTQGAHKTKTIPHCYIVRGVGSSSGNGGFGVVEWHGHPARLEAALCYLMDEDEEQRQQEEEEEDEEGGGEEAVGGSGVGAQTVPVAVPVEG